jgi:hypothetical protein
MARNPVQFQKGLSLIEFNRRYGTDEQCHAALIKKRWPTLNPRSERMASAVAVSGIQVLTPRMRTEV